MHLRSLELTGFKSFAEAKIEFPNGVMSVVGPNGTGKSNVVDAILWVLGEQSAKTLRSERMEDVIFNGTESRKPLGMAEVSLIMAGVAEERLQGLQGVPPELGEFHEVMITRRLYRNGDSEYLINKTPCRLKDVRSVFLDSRAGTKGHTIIEQGRIEQILNASPQDRRELIEETAGIVRYKKQKAEALRKLDSTQQNLLRVRDIIVEVRRQLTSLERQARQARSYQTLQQEAKALEIRLLVGECRVLNESRAAVESELAALEAEEAGLMAEQARLDGDCETLKLQILTTSELLTRIREGLGRVEHEQGQALTAMEVEKGRLALYEQQRTQAHDERVRLVADREQVGAAIAELRVRLSTDEADITARTRIRSELEAAGQAVASQRAAAAQEEERARRDIITITVQTTSARNTLASLGSQDEAALRRLERLAIELADIERQHGEAAERLGGTATSLEQAERTVQQVRLEATAAAEEKQRLEERARAIDQAIGQQQEGLAAIESRLRALQGVLREEMGYGREGDEGTSLRAACADVRESVAEWLMVPAGLERAVEAVLGERMRAWLVEGPTEARRAIEFLNQKGLGRGAFVPVRPRYSSDRIGQDADWWPALQAQPGVLGRAIDLLQARTETPEVLASLFDGVVFVNSLEVAVTQWERGVWSAPDGPALVTIDGEILDAAGVLTGGTAGTSGGVLLRRREVQRLEEERTVLLGALEQNRRERDQVFVLSDASRTAVQRLDETMREADMRVLSLAKDEAALQRHVEDLGGRIGTIRAERATDATDRVRIQEEMDAARREVAELSAVQGNRETVLADLQASLRAMQEETAALQQRVTESRLALASLRARMEHGQADLARLTKEQEEREGRAMAIDRLLEALDVSTCQSHAERGRNEAMLHDLEQRAGQIRNELNAAQNDHHAALEALREVEKALAAARDQLTSTRQDRTGIEVRRAEIVTQLAIRESTLTGTYQLSMEGALAEEANQQSLDMDVNSSQPGVDPSTALRGQLQKIRDRLDRLGPINLAAIEEHRELEERHRFLTTQEEDLSQSVGSLKEIITRINRTTKEMFLETFNELQQKFGEVFGRFFPGGRAELLLTEPDLDPETGSGSDEPGVDIAAQPPGKRLKSLTMLSGGEKTLTAMALIFASFLIRPTPFCILDEIDAPLDEENIGRFTSVLRELSEGAQFIVITHNKRTMAVADSLFGVTMEEPGVSKLVSVRLADLQPA